MNWKISGRFPQKRAWITGAGGGLGRAFALELAADGWTIGITDINEKALEESCSLIATAGGKALPYLFDVSKRADYEKAFGHYVEQTGGLDLIINNAGVGDGGMFGEYPLAHWEWITGINQMAVVYGAHLATEVMKKQKSGGIINIASAAAIANMPNMSMYNVTKAAVLSLSESIYAELHPFNVQVSVVMPTFFKSNIMQFNRGDQNAAQVGQAIINKAKLSPKDVAHTVLKAADRKQFYVLLPFQSVALNWLRRFFPETFLKLKAGIVRKKLEKLKARAGGNQ